MQQATTNSLIESENKYLHRRYNKRNNAYEVVHLITGQVVESSAINTEREIYRFDAGVAERILDLIRNGEKITNICKMEQMPTLSDINAWRKIFPKFDGAYRDAIRERGEVFFDAIYDIAKDEGIKSKEEVASDKVKLDALKWLAEKSDPSRFGGAKDGAVALPSITIKIDTGSKELDNMVVEMDGNNELKRFSYVEESGTEEARSEAPATSEEGPCAEW